MYNAKTIVFDILRIIVALYLIFSGIIKIASVFINFDDEEQENIIVNIGEFEAVTNDDGFISTQLVFNVTNTGDEAKAYYIQIEAVDNDGNKIDEDSIRTSILDVNQSKDFKIFTYVSNNNIEAMENAIFNVVEVSSY